jgi:hypothetical protein
MRQLLVIVAVAVGVIAVTSAPAQASKKKVRVSCCGPVVPVPIVVGRGCVGPVVAIPVVPIPRVVVREGCCAGPVVVAVKPKRKCRIKVAVEAECCVGAVHISTPIGHFSFGR